MEAFDYNNLFQKSKLYVQRALEEDRDSEMFPFWISLSLELLARSTLSKISPALLAEASSGDNSNLLYAFGFKTTNKPRSIQTNEVFQRISKIDIGFTQDDLKIASAIVEQRNAELHSAIQGFSEYPASIWLPDYYRICKKLLIAQKLSLNDLFGSEEGKAAEIMITEEESTTKKTVLDKISAYKKVFTELPVDQQALRIKVATDEIRKNYSKAKIVKCPSCGTDALLSGDLISLSEAKLDGSEIRQERRYIPTKFGCVACGLTLTGYQQIKHTDFSGQFTLTDYLDPLDFHGIDPEEHVDIDQIVKDKLSQMSEREIYEEYIGEPYNDE
jgi:hypothetical protein